jgi:predicted transcriptional regulator
VIQIGAKIPDDLARQIEVLAPFTRGGKSAVIRDALAIGINKLSDMPIMAHLSQSVKTQKKTPPKK